MIKSTHTITPCKQITQPMVREAKPDVSTHEDIDWRTVSVAAAYNEEREQAAAMRAKLASLGRKCGKTGMFTMHKPSKWNTLLQVLGMRRTS